MRQLTATEIANKLDIAIVHSPETLPKGKASFDDYVYGIIANKTGFDKEFLIEMTDLELDYFIDSTEDNFVNLQKETVLH